MRKDVFFLIPVLLIAANIASAQSIRGQVFLPSIESGRIQVTLEKPGGQLVAVTYSDTEGNFFFYNTPASNDYIIVVKLDGYMEVREQLYFSAAGTTNVKISLVRKNPELPAGAGGPGVISMAELRQKYSKKLIDEYEDAQEDNRKGNAARAVERLESVLKQAPDFFQAHNTLATIYQKLERFADAEREYTLASDLNPQFALPMVNLGGLYLLLADARANEGPAVVDSLVGKADSYLRRAVRLDPVSATGFSLLGTVSYRLGAYADAEQSLRKALDLDPTMSSARLTSVNLYARQQKWQDALEHIDAYLEQNSSGPAAEQLRTIRKKVLENTGSTPK